MDIGRNKISMVLRITRPCSHKCPACQNQTQRIAPMCEMRPTRHTTTPADTMWKCDRDLTMNKGKYGVYHAKGPPKHPTGRSDSPQLSQWPRTRQVALLWILAHMTYCVTQRKNRLSLMDYADFLRRVRWKAYNDNHRFAKIGTYLEVL
jgi:hypothetical protein